MSFQLFQILTTLSPTSFAIKIQRPPIDLLAPFESNTSNYQQRSSTNSLLKNDHQKYVSKPFYASTTSKPLIRSTISSNRFISPTKSIFIASPPSRQPRKFAVHSDVAKFPQQNVQLQASSNLKSKRVAANTPAQPAINLNNAGITKDERTTGENGLYHYTFKTMNGINVEERGQSKVLPNEFGGDSNDISQDVQGEYSYIAPDGTEIVMNYIANENGFQPSVII